MPILDKKFNILTNLFVFADMTTGHLNTTLAAARAKNDTTLTLASGTNSSDGDDLRIGTGETMELVRIASGGGTTSVTLTKPLKFDHANGEPVVEQQAFNLGTPEADGFRFRYNGETTDVFNAVSRLAYGVLTGYVDLGGAWRWPTVTVDAIATALGIPRANILGDGTAAVQTGTVGPRLFTTDGALFGTATNVNVVATGTLQDGSHFKLDLYNCTFDPTAFTITFARGQLATVPVRCLASSAAADFTNSAFTPKTLVNTFAASKADIFSEITGVFSLADGTSNTTNGTTNAGAYSIVLNSATGFAPNDIVRIGVGDLAEYHYVHSITTNTLNLRTQILRAHANGVSVAKQTQTSLGVAMGGFTMACAGSVETQRSELFRVSLGYRPQNVAMNFTFNVDAIRPENLYLALGITATEYGQGAGSLVLPMNGNIAKANTATLYFVGLTQGGKTINAIGWNGAAQIGGETQFTQAATAMIPIAYKPNGLNVWVNQ